MPEVLILVPLSASLLPISSAIASYVYAMLFDDALKKSTVIYPSDLLETQPQRGILTAGLTVGGVMSLLVIALRFIQIHTLHRKKCRRLNKISLAFGVMSVVGQVSVCAFSFTEQEYVHYATASLFFLGSAFYMLMQCIISRSVKLDHDRRCLILTRQLCAALGFVCPIMYAVGRLIIGRLVAPEQSNRYFIPHVSEWVMAFLTFLYMGTYCSEFNSVRFKSYRIDRGTNNDRVNDAYFDYIKEQARSFARPARAVHASFQAKIASKLTGKKAASLHPAGSPLSEAGETSRGSLGIPRESQILTPVVSQLSERQRVAQPAVSVGPRPPSQLAQSVV